MDGCARSGWGACTSSRVPRSRRTAGRSARGLAVEGRPIILRPALDELTALGVHQQADARARPILTRAEHDAPDELLLVIIGVEHLEPDRGRLIEVPAGVARQQPGPHDLDGSCPAHGRRRGDLEWVALA